MVALKQGPTYAKEFDYEEFRNYLNELGDSLLVVNDDEIVKVHVHTEDPGLVMQEGLKYGSLVKVKVDNMRNQHEAQVEKEAQVSKPAEEKEYALIAVVAGQGLADIFRAQGVDYVIEGGQTMNPSTEDFVKAVEKVNARNIIFLPNNKNILMGDYGWYKEKVGEALATKRALAKNFSRNADTLYVHADTLRLFSYDLRTDSAYRVLHGYFHVRAYRTDVQAVCDSLVFHSKLRKLSLYRDPIAWSDDRQILGEEINVYTNDSTLDSVYVERQALIVQQLPDTLHFNQVSGNY